MIENLIFWRQPHRWLNGYQSCPIPIEACVTVIPARAQFPESTLADLYDPLTMPAVLQKAHGELDRAVDRCYRKEAFNSDRERVEFLFKLYEQLTAPLLRVAGKVKRKRKAEKEGWCEGAGFCDANRSVAKTRAVFFRAAEFYTQVTPNGVAETGGGSVVGTRSTGSEIES